MDETLVILLSSEDIRELSEANRNGREYIVHAQDGASVTVRPWMPENDD